MQYALTQSMITQYAAHLRDQERAPATIQKYTHDLAVLLEWP